MLYFAMSEIDCYSECKVSRHRRIWFHEFVLLVKCANLGPCSMWVIYCYSLFIYLFFLFQSVREVAKKNQAAVWNQTWNEFTILNGHLAVVSGVTGGGQGERVPPRDFWPGNFCWRIGKKEARKKGKMVKIGKIEKKRRKIVKGKVENWKWK